MRPDVIVVGGGAIGLGVAWRATQRDLTTVVADPSPGTGADPRPRRGCWPHHRVHYGEVPLLGLEPRVGTPLAPNSPPNSRRPPSAPSATAPRARSRSAFDDDDVRALDALVQFQRQLDPARRAARQPRVPLARAVAVARVAAARSSPATIKSSPGR